MHITALYTYPIKGLAGISLTRARVEARGLAYDRRWMLVGQDGIFLSQREFPGMCLLAPEFTASGFAVRDRAGRHEPLHLPLPGPEPKQAVEVRVWEDTCLAWPVSREADEWFSNALHTPCRLVYMPGEAARPVNPQYGQPGEIVSFADSCPLLLIGEASLAGLNSHFETPFPIDRFRPNIVFAGGQAYEEDNWKSFRAGSVLFRGIRRCGRCQVVNIAQQSGEKGAEPLRTLSTYRREGRKIFFGLYAAPEGPEEGHISLGDALEATYGN